MSIARSTAKKVLGNMCSIHRCFFGHHKCATNWMRRYVMDICRIKGWHYDARRGGHDPSFNKESATRFVFYWNSTVEDAEALETGARAVHLIRDPRDALVSGYWSWKQSHQQNTERILRIREQLNRFSFEDGLLLMVDHIICLEQLAGWDLTRYDQVLTIRYEDMLEQTRQCVERMLGFWDISLTGKQIDDVIAGNSFEAITGRQRGSEDTTNHFRKGVAGDWRTCFTVDVTRRFKEKHGQALISLGYEKDLAW